MRSLIVVESMFGNTRAIADAVADGLAASGPATVLDVKEAAAAPDGGVDLLVVGGPTHAFGLTRPGTRRAAQEQGAKGAADVGLREWLANLPHNRSAIPASAFTTRLKKGFLRGSAAKAAIRQLHRAGYFRAAKPVDFWVTGTSGPLRPGELDRARAWGRALGRTFGPELRKMEESR